MTRVNTNESQLELRLEGMIWEIPKFHTRHYQIQAKETRRWSLRLSIIYMINMDTR